MFTFTNITNARPVVSASHIQVLNNNKLRVSSDLAVTLGLPSKNLLIQHDLGTNSLWVTGCDPATKEGRPVNDKLELSNASLAERLGGNHSEWNIDTYSAAEFGGNTYYRLVNVKDGEKVRASLLADCVPVKEELTEVDLEVLQEVAASDHDNQ